MHLACGFLVEHWFSILTGRCLEVDYLGHIVTPSLRNYLKVAASRTEVPRQQKKAPTGAFVEGGAQTFCEELSQESRAYCAFDDGVQR